jgi:hypothetical protein
MPLLTCAWHISGAISLKGGCGELHRLLHLNHIVSLPHPVRAPKRSHLGRGVRQPIVSSSRSSSKLNEVPRHLHGCEFERLCNKLDPLLSITSLFQLDRLRCKDRCHGLWMCAGLRGVRSPGVTPQLKPHGHDVTPGAGGPANHAAMAGAADSSPAAGPVRRRWSPVAATHASAAEASPSWTSVVGKDREAILIWNHRSSDPPVKRSSHLVTARSGVQKVAEGSAGLSHGTSGVDSSSDVTRGTSSATSSPRRPESTPTTAIDLLPYRSLRCSIIEKINGGRHKSRPFSRRIYVSGPKAQGIAVRTESTDHVVELAAMAFVKAAEIAQALLETVEVSRIDSEEKCANPDGARRMKGAWSSAQRE